MGRMLMMYDTLNHITLQGSLDRMDESETSMLWKMLPQADLQKNDLLIFDRYYASHLLFFYLQKRGVQFCFRMKKDWWKIVEAFNKSGKTTQVIKLELPVKDQQEAAKLGISQSTIKVRLVCIELESGETEILLTSLTNEKAFTPEDFKEVYGFRWPVEESYKSFKHKVCIENFSGKSQKAVLQDFYVKLFIMNLTAVAEVTKKIKAVDEYPEDIHVDSGNKFLILTTTFKNIDDESRMIIDGTVYITYNGKEYEFDNSETIMKEGYDLFMDQINPLISKTTKLVYKLPVEMKVPAYYELGRAGDGERIFTGDL